MKLLLLNPPFLPKYSRSSRSPAVTKSGTIYYPLWLAHATGLLEKRGHEVLLLDVPARGGVIEDYRERIVGFNPDIIVVDTSTPSIESDVACLATLKEWFADRKVGVLVGTHPTALVHETCALSPAVDVIARGEYDWSLAELADRGGIPDGVPGLSWRNNGQIVDNPERAPAENLDELPFVSAVYKKHLVITDYFYAHCRNPVVSIFAGRGCPNRCFYCVYPQVMFGNRYRHRSAAHLVDELAYIERELPEVREVLIDDDNFTADQAFVAEVCQEIIQRSIRIPWTAEVRVNLPYDVMRLMRAAGCRLLVAGFESGDQGVLNAINKNATLEQARRFMQDARKAGLRVHGCFMVGNRGETRATMYATLRFALELDSDTVQFFPLMVYPGTEAYRWASENRYVVARSWREWLTADGMHSCVVKTEWLSPEELVDFCDYARRRFYLRPRYLMRKAFDVILHPGEFSRTAKAGVSLVGHFFRRHR